MRFPIPCRVHDWTRGAWADPSGGDPLYDAVLVDAPCTALGTLRRHPDVRWRRSPDDLRHAAKLQRTILAAAAEHVAPGGALVYAVCSPEPEEGLEVIDAFLAAHAAFTSEATLLTAPPRRGEDAHYGVRLRRSSEA